MYYDKLRVLSILNHKGGVAKTTLAKLLSEYIVLMEKRRVLGIDLDPQANFSKRFVAMKETDGSISGQPTRLMAPPPHPDFDPDDPDWENLQPPPPGYWSTAELFRYGFVDPYETAYDNMKIIPAHTTALTELMLEVGKASIEKAFVEQLHSLLLDEYYQENFDIVIIDTPPQVSPITSAAARAATDILIPTQLKEDSMDGLRAAVQLWSAENTRRTADEELKLVGILPTMVEMKFAQQRAYHEEIQGSGKLKKYLLPTPMRRMETYSTSSMSFANPSSLFGLSDKNVARCEAQRFCKEIITGVMQ